MENKDLAPIKKEISVIVNQAQLITVKTEADKSLATSTLSQINKYADSLKARKETVTKPINEALKNIRSLFKPLETQCEEASDFLRQQLSAYQTKTLAEQQKKEAQLAAKLASGKISAETVASEIDKMSIVSSSTNTEDGDVKFVTVKKFEVINLAKLPIEYHLANDTAIRTAMKQGTELPGVKYWEEQSVRNYR
jgi:hypothetical protein